MIKRIVVAGCRNYENYQEAEGFISDCIAELRKGNELIFVSGGCRGADLLGERYAKEHCFAVEQYKADWKRYGRAAGPVRNKKMAEMADYVICFWDGQSRGTKSLIDYATKSGKTVKVKMI